MKKRYILMIVMVVSVLAVGCTESGITAQDTIKVGFIGPLSGNAAILGIENVLGIEAAIDDINKIGGIEGRQIVLLKEDDQLQDRQTINAYQKLTEIDDVDVILSVSYGGLLTLAQTADQTKTVIVNSLDTSEEIADAGEYLFGVGIYDEGIGYTLSEFARQDLKSEKVAILHNQEEPFLTLVRDSFKQRFETLGGKVVIDESYTSATTDFKTVLLKIKEQGIREVIVIGYDEAGHIFRQAEQLGLDFTFLGIDTFTSQNFLENAGSAADNMYITNWDATSQKYKQLEQKVVSKTGSAPEQPLYTAVGYDAMLLVAQAMANGGIRGEALYNEMLLIKALQGVTGTLTMSTDGVVRTVKEQMFQYVDGKFVKVE
jgi:branched-chain amino acid transport system substrate-binding protein